MPFSTSGGKAGEILGQLCCHPFAGSRNDERVRLTALHAGWHEVEPNQEVRESAKRFLRVHDLRTADALQLAAAFFVAEAHPATLEFISLDERLLSAANREGFVIVKSS